MKKDLKSYIGHDADYQTKFGLDSFRDTIEKYEKENMFEVDGFDKAISKLEKKDVHIDIGSGGGWLLFKTSPLFNKVIGIEPSKSACDNVSIIIKEKKSNNIELINDDMVNAIESMNLKKPTFFTTDVVLSHIKDFYVKSFLKLLNSVPNNSSLYFCERYDKNIQQNMWHIRRKYWWAKNLPEWQLTFFDIDNGGYKSGIFGKKVGKNMVTNKYIPSFRENIIWFFDGILNKILRLIRYVKRLLK